MCKVYSLPSSAQGWIGVGEGGGGGGGGGGGARAPSYNMNALGTESEGAQYDSFVFPF